MFHQHAAFGMRLRMLAIDGANAIDNRPEFLLSRSSWLMPAVPLVEIFCSFVTIWTPTLRHDVIQSLLEFSWPLAKGG